MTDQTIPADKVREARDHHRDTAEMATITEVEREIHRRVADVLDDLLPPLPTLADMTEVERAACVGMQADLGQEGRVIILNGLASAPGRVKVLQTSFGVFQPRSELVTPRPDLPRLTWPGDKIAPTGHALPDGFRLADHPNFGRVIVTTPEIDDDGHVCLVYRSAALARGSDWAWDTLARLTFLDGPTAPVEIAPGVVVGMPITDPDVIRWVGEHAPEGTVVTDGPMEFSAAIRSHGDWRDSLGATDTMHDALGHADAPDQIIVVRWGGGDQ